MTDAERASMRARDFWTSLVLLGLVGFFLWRTSLLPFFEASAAGVEARWFNSAALVPYGVFAALGLLALGLLAVSVREGGAAVALSRLRVPRPGRAGRRAAAAAAVVVLYVFALVPRVDFAVASALVIAALILGFHEERARPTLIALAAVAVPSLHALALHRPQAAWSAHADDWTALAALILLVIVAAIEKRAALGREPGHVGVALALGALVPLALVCAMAFGFRQNVPARTGLVFGVIEYHYYVTLRPWLRGS